MVEVRCVIYRRQNNKGIKRGLSTRVSGQVSGTVPDATVELPRQGGAQPSHQARYQIPGLFVTHHIVTYQRQAFVCDQWKKMDVFFVFFYSGKMKHTVWCSNLGFDSPVFRSVNPTANKFWKVLNYILKSNMS